MNLNYQGRLSVLAALIMMTTVSMGAKPAVPNPVLVLTSIEEFSSQGKSWTRYRYEIFNAADYSNDLFAPAPALPPCGNNTRAARTWVTLYDDRGKQLNQFCSLGSKGDLNKIWFSLESGKLPPSWVYVELNDRQTNQKYKSNLAETVQ